MFRSAALAALTAVIWFTLNDTPAVTKSNPPARIITPASRTPVVAAPQATILAQAQTGQTAQPRQARKARPHLRINPRFPYRRYHAVHPLPYDIEYPGPGGVRHCVSRYVTEARAAGTVIVPRTRCWWKRG